MRTKPGGIRTGIEVYKEYLDDSFVNGNVATDGIQYSSVATVGTTAVEVFTALINPGLTVGLLQAKVNLTQKFTGLAAALSGSLAYYWRARTEAVTIGTSGSPQTFTGAYVGLHGTLSKLIGTLIAYEDTLSGNIPLGSIPYAPIRISLMAIGLAAANVEAKVKNSSSVLLVGNIIPGT